MWLFRLALIVPALGSLLGDTAQAQDRSFLDTLFGPPRRQRLYVPNDDGFVPQRDGILLGRVPTRAPPAPFPDGRGPALRQSPPPRARTLPAAKAGTSPTPARTSSSTAIKGPAAFVPNPEPVPEPAVEKRADARTVLVVGDFMAASLAAGLKSAFSKNPDVRIVDDADGSSGFVRSDHSDWVAEIGPLIEAERPAVVVMMLGSNDRQPITLSGEALALRSAAWTEEYQRRLDAFTSAVSLRHVDLVWVGVPAFKSERVSDDMAFFNELYREAAAKAGGQFTDIWDGFVDADGAFSTSGPDIRGQQTRLRNADGITLTAEGREKLAFFTQKPLAKLLGDGPAGQSGLALPAPGVGNTVKGGTAGRTSVAPIALDDPALDGGDLLLGDSGSVVHRGAIAADIAAAPGARGRADDFDWGAKAPSVSPLRDGEASIFRGSMTIEDALKPSVRVPESPMPSLQDAILDDWAKQQKLDAEAKRKVPGKAPGQRDTPAPPATSPNGERG